jgi:hypothetical protein
MHIVSKVSKVIRSPGTSRQVRYSLFGSVGNPCAHLDGGSLGYGRRIAANVQCQEEVADCVRRTHVRRTQVIGGVGIRADLTCRGYPSKSKFVDCDQI